MAVDYQYYEFRAFEYLIRLGQLWEGMEELPGVKKILQKLQEEQALIRSRKFRVAVVGEFRRGKTTFINALLGKEILPVDALPTTATLNRITYGSVPKAYLCWKDGGREEIGIEELSRYVTKLTEASAETASRIAEAVVEYPSIFCQNHVDLIDTPGMNDDMSMNAVTLSQLDHIDLAIVTLTVDTPFSETESWFVAKLLESDEICQIIVVVTKIDMVRREADKEKVFSALKKRIPDMVRERLQETHEEGDPVFEKCSRLLGDPVLFGVSSVDALEARQFGDEELFERSGFSELNDRLPQIILASQNNNSVLRAVHAVRRIAEEYPKKLPFLIHECEEMREGLRKEKIEFARDCYALADLQSLERLKQELWDRIDDFSEIREELVKDFIRCLSTVRVLDAEILVQALKRGAEEAREKLNGRMRQELLPELQGILYRELESWRQGVFCQLRCDVRLQEKGREQVRELAEELAAERDACPAQLAAAPFTWKEYPIPGRNKLLAPDLIAYVRQAVSISVDAWCAQRKAQIRDFLKTASQEASGKLEKIVVALYEAENQRIARWQEREERLKSPELLERLGQLAEENDRLEADFIKEL